jgi:LPPG:FO 2-phospho-L-lactate transferase
MPDHDTVMYTLAGLDNREQGWGLEGESFNAAGMLERYGEETWFRLGDRTWRRTSSGPRGSGAASG